MATRNVILQTLSRIQMPAHLSRVRMQATFSEIFRIVLSDTPNLGNPGQCEDENVIDAIDSLCARLTDRQVIHRVSDWEMTHNIAAITRNLAALDDPTGQLKGTISPRLYVMNCSRCHLVGSSQLRKFGNPKLPVSPSSLFKRIIPICVFQSNPGEAYELPLLRGSRCPSCKEEVTMLREISLARDTWEYLQPLRTEADPIHAERHLPSQFRLAPPKVEMSKAHQSFLALEPVHSIPGSSISPSSYTYTRKAGEPFSPESVGLPLRSPTRELIFNPMASVDSFGHPAATRTIPISPPSLDKSKSKWRTRLNLSRRDTKDSADTSSSLSSSGVEWEKLEEISLRQLTSAAKGPVRGKGARTINVCISQNSADAVFWTQVSMQIWDVSTSPSALKRSLTTEEGTYVLVALTKTHLAYIIGSRNRTLTVRISLERCVKKTAYRNITM
jgi:hypothetical protein